MEDTALLTDDEIVALCAADGRPWPLNLTTVEPTAEDLTRAGVRGMRSLLVRRLAGGNADAPGVRPHEWIARDVSAFLGATERVGAYVAPASDHSTLGGAAVSAARADDVWVLDTSTAAGVHALRIATAHEAADAVLALAESAYSGSLFENADAQWVCVVRFGASAQNTIAVASGSVTGTVDGAPVTSWDPDYVRSLFVTS
ncbi:hypothetical protein H7J08_08520 [Mycobacterium frederiksbergense]|uniref:hypothetical protein n=1 Tax=Mycolicibacterium frederiksbergense TaxID=117567 RepID=UPI0021F2C469|nr:hypothetical protein [Mycolicibacterium frederiksbergense]MCV7044718.1 hypothetical protein [Mycolicibacterium frederiksbergense]